MAVVMGTLWILVFKAPWFFGNNDAVYDVFVFALLLPGTLFFAPVLLRNAHGGWGGYLVLGAILNWLFYSQVVYKIIRFRRRKQEAHLPLLEPERFDYADRWQKPAPEPNYDGLQSATRLHEAGIASNGASERRREYVPGPCTHRPSHHESGLY